MELSYLFILFTLSLSIILSKYLTMKIYTKTGDAGDTSLFSGGRVSKNHIRVEAYGDVDELNSVLGCVKCYLNKDQSLYQQLTRIQHELFALGAVLATPQKSEHVKELSFAHIEVLENEIDFMNESLPELKNFILPDGAPSASNLHLARTVCRRAERKCIDLHKTSAQETWLLSYLNRLSDWLFIAARFANYLENQTETIWQKP